MLAEPQPTNYDQVEAFVTQQFSNDTPFFAPVADAPFKPFSTKMGLGIESPEVYERVEHLLARLLVLQERSEDPDEEGDLPVSDETVEQMQLLIGVLASHFSSDEALWKGVSLSPTPSGGLQISWRAQGDSLSFTVEEGDLEIVTKKGAARPERTVFPFPLSLK